MDLSRQDRNESALWGGWQGGIKNPCGMRDSRSLYLTLDFVCQLVPEATYVRWKEQAFLVNGKKKGNT